MNVDTGELKRLQELQGAGLDKALGKGFVELTEENAVEAERLLGGRESIFLPEDHPLRVKVTGSPMTQRQMEAIVRGLRARGCKSVNDIKDWIAQRFPGFEADRLTVGQAQKVLNEISRCPKAADR